jgi:hypothetical protein
VQRSLARGGDERKVDRGLGDLGELDLCLLRCLLETLQGHLVGREIHAVGVLELLDHPVDDLLVPVVAAELGVAGGGLDLEHTLADLEQRHVERPAAEVEDEDRLVGALLVQAVGKRGRRRLVDDAQHLEPGDLPGLLGGLALGIVEVGGDGDDRLRHGVAEVRLRVTLELPEDLRRDLLRGPLLPIDVDLPVVASHVALDRTNGAVRVGDGLTLGHFTDQDLAALGEADHRGGGTGSLSVGDHGGLASLERGDDRVGCPEVDAYGSGHEVPPVLCWWLCEIGCRRIIES